MEASRTVGLLKLNAVWVPGRTTMLAVASAKVQATPTPRASLRSQTRRTCAGPEVVHLSRTVEPAAADCSGGRAVNPQLRRGPVCPRVQGSVTKLPPGDETETVPKLLSCQFEKKSHRMRETWFPCE